MLHGEDLLARVTMSWTQREFIMDFCEDREAVPSLDSKNDLSIHK